MCPPGKDCADLCPALHLADSLLFAPAQQLGLHKSWQNETTGYVGRKVA